MRPDSTVPGDSDVTVQDLDPRLPSSVWVTPAEFQPGEAATVHYRGILAGSDELSLRYGFDGGIQLDGLEGWQGGSDDSSCPDYWLETAMTRLDRGGFVAEVEIPESSEIFDFWFVAPGDDRSDDNGGLRYHRSFDFPYVGPYLTWNDRAQPHDGVVVGFLTDRPCLGVVSWGLDEPTDLLAGDEWGYRHNIAIEGLEPETTYAYRVHDCVGQQSELFHFTTSAQDASSFRFAVLADMQDDGKAIEGWASVAEQVRAEVPDAAFLLMPGDLPCNDTPGSWWRFFGRGRDLFGNHVMLPVLGNHDTPNKEHDADRSSFEALFDLPTGSGSECHYAVDHGIARVLVLDTEVGETMNAPGTEQYDWIEGELSQSAQEGSWVFVALHEPVYNLGMRFLGDDEYYRPVTALFDGTVDWVFTGHEHIYQRMVPMRYDAIVAPSGAYGRGADDGVGYVVVPTAGDRTFDGAILPHDAQDIEPRSWLAYPVPGETDDNLPAEIGFMAVAIDGEDLELTTWGMGTIDQPEDAHVVESYGYSRGE